MQTSNVGSIKTVTSVSGGKSSAYTFLNYPSDLAIFSLVRLEATRFKWMKGKDEKTRQLISDRLGLEFIGTAEMDEIIYTILDLEQLYGREIKIVTGVSFEELIKSKKGLLPSYKRRFCTTEFKIVPIYNYLYEIGMYPVVSQLGFRKGEEIRLVNATKKVSSTGYVQMYIRTSQKENSRYHNRVLINAFYPVAPLINDEIQQHHIDAFFSTKKIRFASYNNCVGCVNRNPLFLNHLSKCHSYEFSKFIYLEKLAKSIWLKKGWQATPSFRPEGTMESFANPKIDFGLFATDFNDCDSGHCGV